MSGPEEDPIEARRRDIDRRRALALAAAAALAAAMPGPALAQRRSKAEAQRSRPQSAAPRPARSEGRFFTQAELELLDELAEQIIPADERSGGARAAGVAERIEAKVSESIDPQERKSWKDDLSWLDELSRQTYGRRFVALSPEQKTAFLTRCSANEAKPSKPEEFAFATIKWEVTLAYYTSRIGLLDEIGYQGNVAIDEFHGTDVSSLPPGRPLQTGPR